MMKNTDQRVELMEKWNFCLMVNSSHATFVFVWSWDEKKPNKTRAGQNLMMDGFLSEKTVSSKVT